MSTKYTKIFSIPDATSTVLTDLTRNLLRASTYSNDINDLGDLYAFSYQHFMDALDARNGAFDEEEMGGGKMSNDELIERVTFLFDQADADGNGYLDRQEFKEVFKSLKNELGLSNKMVKQIMAEADENDDGVIEYKEFVPIAVDVINVLEAKQDFEAQKAMDAEDAVEDAKVSLPQAKPQAKPLVSTLPNPLPSLSGLLAARHAQGDAGGDAQDCLFEGGQGQIRVLGQEGVQGLLEG